MTRPTDSTLAAMLREAAKRIDAKAGPMSKGGFSDRNFANNDLRKAADALEQAPEWETNPISDTALVDKITEIAEAAYNDAVAGRSKGAVLGELRQSLRDALATPASADATPEGQP